MTERRIIPVVCAVIESSGRVLVAQRPVHKHLGGKWEFPGGKVEAGEEPKGALVREIGEELGCQIDGLRSLPEFDHDYGDVVIHMIPFVCRLSATSADPVAHEHVALRWVDGLAVRSLDLAPADWPVVENYFASSR